MINFSAEKKKTITTLSLINIECAAINYKNTPKTNIIIFSIVQYVLTKFSQIIRDPICRYCSEFCHFNFRCSEVAQL